MSKHIAILSATSAIAMLATPAMAQQLPVDDSYVAADAAWQAEAEAGATYADVQHAVVQDISSYETSSDYDEQYEFEYEHEGRDKAPHAPYSDAPRYAYTGAQREEWLSQCRALRSDYDGARYYREEDDDDNGGLLGGLLGAVAGGVIGNRVADGERLAGTLIGAGLGGLAGAVIGSAIDSRNDDDYDYYADEGYSFDYCEAYLINYERGYGVPGQMSYAPVAMVPVAQQQIMHHPHETRRRMITRVIEEDVAVEREHRHVRRSAPPRQTGKLQPLR